MDFSKLIAPWVGSISRWAIGIASGYLIKSGFLAADQANSGEAILAGAMLAAAALAWSAVNKYILHKQIQNPPSQ